MKRVLSAALLYCHFFAIIWLFFVCLFYVKIYCYILNECFIVDILFKIVHRFVGFVLQFSWFKCSFAIKMAIIQSYQFKKCPAFSIIFLI